MIPRTILAALLSGPAGLTMTGLGVALVALALVEPLAGGQPLTWPHVATGGLGAALLVAGTITAKGAGRRRRTKPPEPTP